MFSIFEGFFWEIAVKYFSFLDLNNTHLLDRCRQFPFLRFFVPIILPKMNMNSNKGKIALGKKEKC